MTNIRRCCPNISIFLIHFQIGTKYYVCDYCSKLDYWSRGIKSKTEIKIVSN